MFVPLHDDTPLKVIRFQFVTLTIILGNVIIFLMTGAFQSDAMLAGVATSFGVVPSDFTIRDARADDAPALLDIYRPFVLDTSVSFELTPPTIAEFEARVARILVASGQRVHTGDPLVQLDDSQLRQRVESAIEIRRAVDQQQRLYWIGSRHGFIRIR